ncbi:SapC family protein [Pseudoalteromonas sp. MMG022]|uniref:SapC family protein n=1 Tax=Pseudoalteromonas sp. MMG022 TaxID=2909978 RepID=UPI001F214139|nr:SapC family protein [Pseudoalteromonas sp. MMG022]MCF6434002.1 SapC family protein [Pseudoalteromonas sp. MMG022]
MSQEQLLDNITHKDIKVITNRGEQLGDNVSIARVFPCEYAQLQSEYTIFFKKDATTGQFQSVVLLGFNDNENVYLQGDSWDADYIPLSIQRQPFLIGFVEKQQNGMPVREPAVHIDMNHPRVNTTLGETLFTQSGGMTGYLEKINRILLTIHQGHDENQAFLNDLVAYNLLESALINLGAHQLKGLYTINEDALKRLNDDAVLSLNRKGYLQHIYMVLASLGQLRALIKKGTR